MQTIVVKIVKTEDRQVKQVKIPGAMFAVLAKEKKVILNVRYVEVVNTVQKQSMSVQKWLPLCMNVTNVMQVNLVNLFFGHLVSKNNLLLEMLVQL